MTEYSTNLMILFMMMMMIALNVDANSVKALMRRAQAQRELHAFDEAKASLAKARAICADRAKLDPAAAGRFAPAIAAEVNINIIFSHHILL